jgi:hypothetical protein
MKNVSFENIFMAHKGKFADKWEFYFEAYDEIFHNKAKIETFLEIGIQNGGSLEVWSKYFPNLKLIVGCDIDENCNKLIYEDQRIQFIVQDANSSIAMEKIQTLSPTYNVILDDGSHHSSDIIASFLNYFPLLSDDGLYVIEDLHASYWEHYGGGLGRPDSAIEFCKQMVDIVNFEHWGLPVDRRSVFGDFGSFGMATFPEDVLASIHSVTFMNSICVIRKKAASRNELGRRLIHGEELPVTIERKAWSGLTGEAPNQISNPYIPKTNDQATLRKMNGELVNRIASLENSRIWRLTGLTCSLKSNLKRVKSMLQK